MNFTGERLMAGIEGNIKAEHLHRYAIAYEFVAGKVILDIACGDGYGSNLLANTAAQVYGVDIEPEVIAYAKQQYKKPNLNFITGDIRFIPFSDSFFDIVVCFETFEHVMEHNKVMFEFKRVLKTDGILIMSTPEKKSYSDLPNYSNPFHKKELYYNEYVTILEKNFKNNQFLLQKFISGSFIHNENSNELLNLTGSYNHIKKENSFNPMYIISISSNQNLKFFPNSIFVDSNNHKTTIGTLNINYKKKILNIFRFIKSKIKLFIYK